MSVEDKLNRLVIARDNIRAALGEQGIDASDHGFEGFAEDIGDIESLPDVDDVAFGNDPTLPAEGKTNPANYEAIADAINAAKARSNAVTLESLTVTQNGTQIAPAGTAWNEVEVDVVAKLQNKTVTQNGAVAPDAGYDGLSEVVVNVPTGGGETETKDVNFYDYDGTITNSYTAQEFSALTEMPANPSHEGLTAQGWNWTLTDAKAYVASYGMLDIGQTCIPTDGKTHVYFTLDSVHLTPYLGFGLNGTAVINWGDGSAEETVTGSSVETLIKTPHTYADIGDYEITIDVTSGTLVLKGNSSTAEGSDLLGSNDELSAAANYYRKHITKIEIGSGITSINVNAFYNCYALQTIVIPNGITSIGASAFGECFTLQSVVIPESITSIGASAFGDCCTLQSVVIPYGMTSISGNMCGSCFTLQSVIIPDSVTSIGSGAFGGCYALQSVIIPDSVTIVNGVFQNCRALQSIVIPDSVTGIGAKAFYNCYAMSSLTFMSTTPPTVAASNAFQGLPTDCIIRVPAGSLSAYTSATNYPSSSTYTYVEYS